MGIIQDSLIGLLVTSIITGFISILFKFFTKDIKEFKEILKKIERMLPPEKKKSKKSTQEFTGENAFMNHFNNYELGPSQTNMGITQVELDKFVKELEVFVENINRFSIESKYIKDELKGIIHVIEDSKVKKITTINNLKTGESNTTIEDSDNYEYNLECMFILLESKINYIREDIKYKNIFLKHWKMLKRKLIIYFLIISILLFL